MSSKPGLGRAEVGGEGRPGEVLFELANNYQVYFWQLMGKLEHQLSLVSDIKESADFFFFFADFAALSVGGSCMHVLTGFPSSARLQMSY